MGPFRLRRLRAFAALAAAAVVALTLSGASAPKKKRSDSAPPKSDESVGDLAFVRSQSEIKLEGVGLVVGLENSGVNAPNSWYRQKLLDDMRKEGVENANKILNDPRVAMVVVRVKVPAGVNPSDRLDAEVELPPACALKDPGLSGGYLLRCRLREVMFLGGSPKEGQEMAFAQGPVMIGNGAKPGDNKVGRILGGAHVKKEMPYQLILKENRKSFRTSAMVEAVINQRFPQTKGVEQKGSALAKTDQFLVLHVPPIYHQDQNRFFEVVRLLPMYDSPAARVERIAAWGKELMDPAAAGRAALRLEGIGVAATDVLRTGLSSPNAQVRFFAAEALAYLNDSTAVDVLGESIVKLPEFRAQALAALAAMDDPAARMKLRKLMDVGDVLVRYGAFNALRTAEPNDPFLGRVHVLEAPKEESEDDDPSGDVMAVAIARANSRQRREDPFALYLVDCEGPPMVHVSQSRRCELVVFGRGQKLQTPIVLGNGPIMLNASDGDDAVQISKIVVSRYETDQKVQSSLEIGDVVRQAANLGANYPEIVTLLQAADRQKNLPGPLVVDAMPGTTLEYYVAERLGKDATAKKDDALMRSSGEKAEANKSAKRSMLDWFRRPKAK